MTEFDEMFPKRENPEIELKLEELESLSADELLLRSFSEDITKLWRCEDRIKPLLTAFIEEMGENYLPRSAKKRRSLEASARDIIEEIGEDVEFVRWACRYQTMNELKVKDLRSLDHLIPDWRAMGKTTDEAEKFRIDARKYLKGIDDDCN